MSGKTKKIFCCLVLLVSLFILSNCSKEKEEILPATRSGNQHTLIYTAGANGGLGGHCGDAIWSEFSPQTLLDKLEITVEKRR